MSSFSSDFLKQIKPAFSIYESQSETIKIVDYMFKKNKTLMFWLSLTYKINDLSDVNNVFIKYSYIENTNETNYEMSKENILITFNTEYSNYSIREMSVDWIHELIYFNIENFVCVT